MARKYILWLDVGTCFCAGCNKELIGEKTARLLVDVAPEDRPYPTLTMERVYGRITEGVADRPYCKECYVRAIQVVVPELV